MQTTQSSRPLAANKHSMVLCSSLISRAAQGHCVWAPQIWRWPFYTGFILQSKWKQRKKKEGMREEISKNTCEVMIKDVLKDFFLVFIQCSKMNSPHWPVLGSFSNLCLVLSRHHHSVDSMASPGKDISLFRTNDPLYILIQSLHFCLSTVHWKAISSHNQFLLNQ